MGIQGLLKALNPLLVSSDENFHHSHRSYKTNTNNATRPNTTHNIRQFSNQTLAIDASSWIYKACYSCAERIVESIESGGNNAPDPISERILCKYITSRCEELLLNASLRRVYLVFDGKRCPLKAVTNKEREDKRQKSLMEARKLKSEGKKWEAQEKYRSCVKVMDWMGTSVAKAVWEKWGKGFSFNKRKFNDGNCSDAGPRVQCVFSPFEADAQLAKLCIDGLADAVITEDSDVLVYSAACNVPFPIIFKLDRDSGECNVITMDWLLSQNKSRRMLSGENKNENILGYSPIRRYLPDHHINDSKTVSKSKKGRKSRGGALLTSLRSMQRCESRKPGSGRRMFIQSCVLSGCDYAPSRLVGVGLITAFKIIHENSHREGGSRFNHVLKSLPREKIIMPDTDSDNASKDYEELLAKSEVVFYHHYVRQLSTQRIVPLVKVKKVQNKDNASEGSVFPCSDIDNIEDIVGHEFLPCIKRFENDLSFVGYAMDSVNGESRTFITVSDKSCEKNLSKALKMGSTYDEQEKTLDSVKSLVTSTLDVQKHEGRKKFSPISSLQNNQVSSNFHTRSGSIHSFQSDSNSTIKEASDSIMQSIIESVHQESSSAISNVSNAINFSQKEPKSMPNGSPVNQYGRKRNPFAKFVFDEETKKDTLFDQNLFSCAKEESGRKYNVFFSTQNPIRNEGGSSHAIEKSPSANFSNGIFHTTQNEAARDIDGLKENSINCPYRNDDLDSVTENQSTSKFFSPNKFVFSEREKYSKYSSTFNIEDSDDTVHDSSAKPNEDPIMLITPSSDTEENIRDPNTGTDQVKDRECWNEDPNDCIVIEEEDTSIIDQNFPLHILPTKSEPSRWNHSKNAQCSPLEKDYVSAFQSGTLDRFPRQFSFKKKLNQSKQSLLMASFAKAKQQKSVNNDSKPSLKRPFSWNKKKYMTFSSYIPNKKHKGGMKGNSSIKGYFKPLSSEEK